MNLIISLLPVTAPDRAPPRCSCQQTPVSGSWWLSRHGEQGGSLGAAQLSSEAPSLRGASQLCLQDFGKQVAHVNWDLPFGGLLSFRIYWKTHPPFRVTHIMRVDNYKNYTEDTCVKALFPFLKTTSHSQKETTTIPKFMKTTFAFNLSALMFPSAPQAHIFHVVRLLTEVASLDSCIPLLRLVCFWDSFIISHNCSSFIFLDG